MHLQIYSLLTNDNKAKTEFNPFPNFNKFIEFLMLRQ